MSQNYFSFIGSVWDLLSTEDRNRMGETWKAYEQIIASVYQNFSEVGLNIAVQDLVQYTTQRWLPYAFNENNFIPKPAIFTSNQDLSQGINLLGQYLVKISVDSGPPIEVDLRGVTPINTKINEIVTKLNTAFGFTLSRAVSGDSLLQLVSSTLGPSSTITFLVPSDPLLDASEFVFGILQSSMPITVPEFPWVYQNPYPMVHSIPEFRNAIRDDSVTLNLVEGVDYALETQFSTIRFKTEAPPYLWAKRTLVDDETPYNNFGFLMEIYQANKPSYLAVVQGLWFAFWNGPKPDNLVRALYLLFGLPTAGEDTVITKVNSTTIETLSPGGVFRTFTVPTNLVPIVVLGQKVTRYQPLVNGITVIDKINHPGFIVDEVGRLGIQRFLTENATRGVGDTDETKALTMLEEHVFLPQVSVDAFISSNIDIASVSTFLKSIKPLNKTFLFQVIAGEFKDGFTAGDDIKMELSLDVTPNLDSNQTTFTDQTTLTDYETIDNDDMNLDSDGALFQESVDIDVYQGLTLIDSFSA